MKAIFAVNAADGFAVGSKLPWPHSTTDMKRFRQLTSGGTVVMGRGTWESDMPTPLPNRKNVVLSKTLVDSRCTVCATIPELLEEVQHDSEVWVIGGAETLWALRPYITDIHLSIMLSTQRADITFDVCSFLENYELINKQWFDDHKYKTYRRVT